MISVHKGSCAKAIMHSAMQKVVQINHFAESVVMSRDIEYPKPSNKRGKFKRRSKR